MNASLSTFFVMSYPYSVFTELNMMLVRLSGANSPRDSKYPDLLAQWMSLPPLIRARFSEAMDHAPLLAVHKSKVRAICMYAEARFLARYLIGLLLELVASRSASVCCLSTSPASATPTPLALGCPSHGPCQHGTNLMQRGSD